MGNEVNGWFLLDPRYFWVLCDVLVWLGASYAKYHLMQQKGSVWWRIRWNVGFEIPIIIFWELVKIAAGSIGPRTVVWRLKDKQLGQIIQWTSTSEDWNCRLSGLQDWSSISYKLHTQKIRCRRSTPRGTIWLSIIWWWCFVSCYRSRLSQIHEIHWQQNPCM